MTILDGNMNNPWIFSDSQLTATPSSLDGYTIEQEIKCRIDAVNFIRLLGGKEFFGLSYNTIATAAVFFHRFYMFYSFRTFPVHPMAATCLFLAGKAEETPKKSNDIIKHARTILGDEFEALGFGPDPKEEILTLERILLQTLRFDLEVEHPYEYLIKYTQQITASQQGLNEDETRTVLLQKAWAFTNDSCCTMVCLKYEPEIVAIALIFLASKTGSIEIKDWEGRQPHHSAWWDAHVANLVPDPTLENICHKLLDVYQNTNAVPSQNNNTVASQ